MTTTSPLPGKLGTGISVTVRSETLSNRQSYGQKMYIIHKNLVSIDHQTIAQNPLLKLQNIKVKQIFIKQFCFPP